MVIMTPETIVCSIPDLVTKYYSNWRQLKENTHDLVLHISRKKCENHLPEIFQVAIHSDLMCLRLETRGNNLNTIGGLLQTKTGNYNYYQVLLKRKQILVFEITQLL